MSLAGCIHDGADPLVDDCPIATERSMVISIGNAQPSGDLLDNFYFRLLKEILAQTDFRVAQTITPAELDHFCGRFHGRMSQAFVDAENIVYPGVLCLANKKYRDLNGAELTR